jgi:hypothetical protein
MEKSGFLTQKPSGVPAKFFSCLIFFKDSVIRQILINLRLPFSMRGPTKKTNKKWHTYLLPNQ